LKQENIEKALAELKLNLIKRFNPAIELYLFGSVARGDYEDDSDIDVLVLMPGEINNSIEEEIFDEAYEIELKYDVIFGVIACSNDFWNSERAKVMPLYLNIKKESVKI